MTQVTSTDMANFAALGRAQLLALSRDMDQPRAVRDQARAARKLIATAKLRQAVDGFNAATETLTPIIDALIDITDEARKHSFGDAVAVLTPLIRRASDAIATIGELPDERAIPADPDAGAPVPTPGHAPAAGAAAPPPPNTATNSRSYAALVDEYVAMFDAMQPHADRAPLIDRMRRRLAQGRPHYEKVGGPLAIPWHFIGLIHGMESSFNFGAHLHNGDSLNHRTVHVPAGKPERPDPPFAWATSAAAALAGHGLQGVGDWSLPRQLFELERYNGFGYRFRGLATPYLWSFSDRYVRGRFVSDGKFDPQSVSRQVGAAVTLKALIDAQDIARPPN